MRLFSLVRNFSNFRLYAPRLYNSTTPIVFAVCTGVSSTGVVSTSTASGAGNSVLTGNHSFGIVNTPATSAHSIRVLPGIQAIGLLGTAIGTLANQYNFDLNDMPNRHVTITAPPGLVVEINRGPYTNLDALTDVDVTGAPPSDGSELVFNATTGQWIPRVVTEIDGGSY